MATPDVATLVGHLVPLTHQASSIVYTPTSPLTATDVQGAIDQLIAAGSINNSFVTMAVPSGTNPVATSPTDTLTWANGAGISISGNSGTKTITVTSTITQYTDEQAQDATASLIQNGTGISWSYNDAGNTLTPTVTLAPFSTTNLAEGSNLYFTDERAQDAVGNILTDTSSIDFTYNDAGNIISAVVLPAGVDHNSLANLTTGDPHTQYTKDPGAVVNKEITIWSGTGGRDFATSSGIQIGGTTALQIAPSAANTNLLLDGNGTGMVQLNAGADIQIFPKAKPASGSLIAPVVLTISTFTGQMAWASLAVALTPSWQTTYNNSAVDESFTLSSSGGLTIKDNATPIGASLFRVTDSAAATEYFKVLATGFSGTRMDVDNVRVDGNTVSSTSGALILDAAATAIQMSDVVEMALNVLKFGASNEASIAYATSLVINPKVSGAADVVIGSSAASGGNDADLRINKLGLFGSDISATAVVNFSATSTARQALFFSNTYTGSGSSNASVVGAIIDQGTNASLTNTNFTSQYTLKSTSHTTNTVSGFIAQLGIDASIAIASGTYTHYGLRSAVSNNGVGGSHTGGTFRRYGLYQEAIGALGGTPTADLIMGSFWNNSMNFPVDTPIIFDSTLTALGDTNIKYVNANTDLEVTVDGTLSWLFDTTLNTSKVVLGTIAGTSTTVAKVGGTINVNTSAVANGTTVETDLITFSVPANSMATNGDSIYFEMAGTYTANANTKRVKIKYGATTMFDSTALVINGGKWFCSGRVIRTGAATQTYYGSFSTNNTLLVDQAFEGTAAETLSGAVTLKSTGQSNTASNDVNQTNNFVRFDPTQ